MGSFGQCSICGERIIYSPDCIANLGLHLLEKHPQSEIGHFALVYDKVPPVESYPCGCLKTDTKKKSKFYKTTIESWKRAQIPQKCMKCGKVAIPLIRRQRHKLSQSPFGAFVLLGCWPICFLPFILGGSDLMYLYCKECGNFLGVHDRRYPEKETNSKFGIDKGPICHCD